MITRYRTVTDPAIAADAIPTRETGVRGARTVVALMPPG
jgi:hypothetical protein